MTQANALYRHFNVLVEEGLLGRLGAAFAQFIGSLSSAPASIPLLVGAALLSELEGRGHSCLDLTDLVPDPCKLLSWSPEHWQELLGEAGELPLTVQDWHAALAACPQVRVAGAEDKQQPLVLDQHRLYLRRYWRDEKLVADTVSARTLGARETDCAKVRTWLDRLFDKNTDKAAGPDWQKIACAVAIRSHFSIITGGPGTGKTYTVARLIALMFALAEEPEKLRIALAAPTGKAATRLKQSIQDALAELTRKVGDDLPLAALASRMSAASTLHNLLGARPDTRYTRHHAGNPLDLDVLIVDEASMVHLEMMASLLAALPDHAMIVLLGDKDQLASVEAGAVLGDLCHGAQAGNYSKEMADYVSQACGESVPADMITDGSALAQHTVMLRESRRFSGAIGELANAVNGGKVEQARAVLKSDDKKQVAWMERASMAEVLDLALHGRDDAAGFAEYLRLLKAGRPNGEAPVHEDWVRSVLLAFDRFRVLCAIREGEWGVSGLNAAIEKCFNERGLLRCRGEWYVGRPVMVTRNDYGLGVFNGDVGITLPDPSRDGLLRVYFLLGNQVRSVLATRLAHVETAYAMTVHKVQGSEFLHAAMVLPPKAVQVVTRELIYTGITRARERFTLVSSDAAVLDEAIRKQTRRASGLQGMIGKSMA